MIFSLAVFGCEDRPGGEVPASDESAAPVASKPGEALTLYNYEEYIGSTTVENFEKKTGVSVNEVYFSDEEEMVGAVQSDLAAYDLVVVSDDTLREMREAKLLAPLDCSKIPNLAHIGKAYRTMGCDPGLEYSVPYLVGTTRIAINKKYVKEGAESWEVLFDKRYAGKIAMLNNPFEVVGAACKLKGYSINTNDSGQLAAVREQLLAQKAFLYGDGYYDSATMTQLLVDEKVWAAHIYSGEGLVAMEENKSIVYVIPQGGAPLWVDFFAIPRDAPHQKEAHMFLNYILDPDVNASIASELWYLTANKSALSLMDSEVIACPSVNPPPEVLASCEYFNSRGEINAIIASIWSDLMVED